MQKKQLDRELHQSAIAFAKVLDDRLILCITHGSVNATRLYRSVSSRHIAESPHKGLEILQSHAAHTTHDVFGNAALAHFMDGEGQ